MVEAKLIQGLGAGNVVNNPAITSPGKTLPIVTGSPAFATLLDNLISMLPTAPLEDGANNIEPRISEPEQNAEMEEQYTETSNTGKQPVSSSEQEVSEPSEEVAVEDTEPRIVDDNVSKTRLQIKNNQSSDTKVEEDNSETTSKQVENVEEIPPIVFDAVVQKPAVVVVPEVTVQQVDTQQYESVPNMVTPVEQQNPSIKDNPVLPKPVEHTGDMQIPQYHPDVNYKGQKVADSKTPPVKLQNAGSTEVKVSVDKPAEVIKPYTAPPEIELKVEGLKVPSQPISTKDVPVDIATTIVKPDTQKPDMQNVAKPYIADTANVRMPLPIEFSEETNTNTSHDGKPNLSNMMQGLNVRKVEVEVYGPTVASPELGVGGLVAQNKEVGTQVSLGVENIWSKISKAPVEQNIKPNATNLVPNVVPNMDVSTSGQQMGSNTPFATMTSNGQNVTAQVNLQVNTPAGNNLAQTVQRIDTVTANVNGSNVKETVVKANGVESAQTQERVEFIDRIVKAARLTQIKGQARMKIVLNPPQLGSLKVDLVVRDKVLTANLQTDNISAKELILSHLSTLKDSLENQGIKVGDFSVSVQQGFEDTGNGSNRSSESDQSNMPAYGESTAKDDEPEMDMRRAPSSLQLIDVFA